MSIEFDGLEQILKSLDKPVSQERLSKTLMKACLFVERRAKELVPKDTGDLGRSITSRVEDGAGIVYTPLEYAPYVEYETGLFAESGGRKDVPWAYEDEETGELIWTSGQHPQPFMRPALDESREDIKRIFREGLLND
jgi:HK97 gp10 family phage protein